MTMTTTTTGNPLIDFAFATLTGLVKAVPDVMEIVTGHNAKTLKERIDRAREAYAAPIDPSESDKARRERFIAIVRGSRGAPSSASPPDDDET